MKRYGWFSVVLVLCSFTSCGGYHFPWQYYNAESFIAYYLAGDIKARSLGENCIELYWDTFDTKEYSYKSKGEEEEVYGELCVKHNDLGYNERKVDPKDLETGDFTYRMVYWKDFVAIDVVSDRDFDTEHPAGSSLGDIVEYGGWSYWEYIKNNYTGHEENHISGYINDLPEDGLCLIKDLFLYFNEVPESAVGKHNLTITIIADDGTVFELDCPIELKTIDEEDKF